MLHSQYLVAGEFLPLIMHFNAGFTEKNRALLAVSSGLFTVAVLTVILLGPRHLL